MPQLMPGPVTVPEPSPDLDTDNVLSDWNSAFTLQAWVIDTVHVPVPEQAPDQPVNDDPDDAVAERVTDVPCV